MDPDAEKEENKNVAGNTAEESSNLEESQVALESQDDPQPQEGDEEEFPPDLAGEEEEEAMEVVGEGPDGKGENADDRKVICSELAATRIHKMISVSLIPQLHRVITQRVCFWCFLLLFFFTFRIC